MKTLIISLLFSLFSTMAFAAAPAKEHTDVFHDSAFGPMTQNTNTGHRQIPKTPSWTAPNQTPKEQRMEEIPRGRVNEWSEQNKDATESKQ